MTANIKFKEAMSLIPSSVAIVWLKNDQDQLLGCTISSFISVSVIEKGEEVAFVLRNDSRTGQHIKSSQGFKISILSRDQIEIARIFSKGLQIDDLNSAIRKYPLWDENSICEFSLAMKQKIILSNSTIFLASVSSFVSNPELKPLIYATREYF